jgi:hypothetical protein
MCNAAHYSMQVTEKEMVGTWGLEPQTSTVSKDCSVGGLADSVTCMCVEWLSGVFSGHEWEGFVQRFPM